MNGEFRHVERGLRLRPTSFQSVHQLTTQLAVQGGVSGVSPDIKSRATLKNSITVCAVHVQMMI